MSNKGLGIFCMVLAILVVLLGTVGGTYWALENYAFVGGHFYSVHAQYLDLRDRDISASDYGSLSRRIPGCEIVWNMPFQGKMLPSDVAEVTVNDLSDDDVVVLSYAKKLKALHAEGCTDYPQLLEFQKRRPDCDVFYNVTIDGESYPQDAVQVKTPGLTAEDIASFPYLPMLSYVDADGCQDYDLLLATAREHPEWNITYSVAMGTDHVNPSDSDAEVEGAAYQELVNGIRGLPELKSLTLVNPEASYEEVQELRQDNPNLTIDLKIRIFDREYDESVEELDISEAPIESTEQAAKWASYFPKLTKLIVDSGDIDNEAMAAFREEQRPNYKVVWTVVHGTGNFGIFAQRTDETEFMPLKHNIYWFKDADMENVKYMEDLVAMDVGHMSITNVDFAEYLPHLKYLILNLTQVRDISGLSNCKELVFLELCQCPVQDYSPLLGCTALEDLNLGRTYADYEPIGQMTWLKNLWWVRRSSGVLVELQKTLTDTNMLFMPNTEKGDTSFGWRKLPNYYAMRDALGMPYMD